MSIPMATYFTKQSYLTRYSGVLFSPVGSSDFCFNTQKILQKTCKGKSEFKQRCSHVPFRDKGKAGYPDTMHAQTNKEDISRETLIWRATKLPIYSVALVPLTVGSAAAYLQTGLFNAGRFFVLLVSSVLIIAWLNLSNDAYDFETGADKNKPESVVNLVGSRTVTLAAAYFFLVLGFIGLTWASLDAGNTRGMLLLTCAVFCGYIYQCPPFRLSYQGLGEPLCFAAFGPFATTAFYLLLGSTRENLYISITGTILSASLLVGLTTTLILFCSHFHQVEDDQNVEKMSPLVLLGTNRGSELVKFAVCTLYSLLFVISLNKALPLTCIVLCAMTLPMGKFVVSFVEKNHQQARNMLPIQPRLQRLTLPKPVYFPFPCLSEH